MPACLECDARIGANVRICPVCHANLSGGKAAQGKKRKKSGKKSGSSGAMWLLIGGGGLLLVAALGLGIVFILPGMQKANSGAATPVAQSPNAAPADPSATTAAGAGTGTMAPVSGQTRAALNPEQERIEKRRQAQRHLEIIGLNCHNLHDIYSHFPPIATASQPKAGEVPQSWMCDILPFDEYHRAMYNTINRKEVWTASVNAGPFQTVVTGFLDPAAPVGIKNAQGYALAHFAANSQVISDEKYLSLREITDGASNVMLAGTITDGFKAWGDPTNHRDASRGFGGSADAFGSPHQGRALILMADGSVKLIQSGLSLEICAKLADPADGQPVQIDVVPE